MAIAIVAKRSDVSENADGIGVDEVGLICADPLLVGARVVDEGSLVDCSMADLRERVGDEEADPPAPAAYALWTGEDQNPLVREFRRRISFMPSGPSNRWTKPSSVCW